MVRRTPAVVCPQAKCDLVVRRQRKTACNRASVLERLRPAHAKLTRWRGEHQVAFSGEPHSGGALESKSNKAGIGAGRDHEIVFELPLIAVPGNVYAGIDLPGDNAAKVWYFRLR